MILLVGNWKMAPEKSTDALVLAKKTLEIAKTYKKNIQAIKDILNGKKTTLVKKIEKEIYE